MMNPFHITVAIIGAFLIGLAVAAGAVVAIVLYGGKLIERNKRIQAAKEELRKAMHGRGAFTLKNMNEAVSAVPGVAFALVTAKEAPFPGIVVRVAIYEGGYVAAFGEMLEAVSRLTPTTIAVEYEVAIVVTSGSRDQVEQALNEFEGLK